MSVGPYCDLAQDVDSANWTQGAVVSLRMDENEREFDRCPMYFNDGSDPWQQDENYVRVFDFSNYNSATTITNFGVGFILALIMVFLAEINL